jgi:hypothetical protein
VIFVDNTIALTKAKLKEYSLTSFAYRAKKDSCLHDDVVNYITKHDTSLDNLVNMLLNNHFSSLRQTDF